ncbi:lipopolysaccharide biosynthesis protein [Phocaeicola sp.]
MDNSRNNKRIAKNTLLLYFRMLLTMGVSLYTSRIILETLGVDDFGIYNVVGGIVAMFAIISSSLSSAISRFITYELGQGNNERLKVIFSTAVNIQIALSVCICFLVELVGTWFLNNKMNIPVERMEAANWVLQCSIFTFMVNLISVPYNASIIAHERMKAFAYIGLLEVTLKLLIALILYWSTFDKLIIYAILLLLVSVIIRWVYGVYCKRQFEECSYRFVYDKIVIKEIGGFASWSFIGSSSAILRDHGGNILLNLFCGPVVNAARGIATQVNVAVQNFVTNFMMALNPQIIKSYAMGEHKYMMALIFQGARLSFYMLLLLSLPIFIHTEYLLTLWLKVVPDHSVSFVRLILVFSMCESISTPLITAVQATGRVKAYQLVVGGLQMINLPASYILLRLGGIPESTLLVAIGISQCCLVARLYMLRRMIGMSIAEYMRKVYLNILGVACLSSVTFFLPLWKNIDTFPYFIISSITIALFTLMLIFFVGCNGHERAFVLDKLKNIHKKIAK